MVLSKDFAANRNSLFQRGQRVYEGVQVWRSGNSWVVTLPKEWVSKLPTDALGRVFCRMDEQESGITLQAPDLTGGFEATLSWKKDPQ